VMRGLMALWGLLNLSGEGSDDNSNGCGWCCCCVIFGLLLVAPASKLSLLASGP
jgi:hypothetical protein